jgi:drug/metabolite transporter (DMT)-like permease
MALESLTPATLVCLRYTISGSFMLGCLAFAEQWVPSGLAALFVSTSPFWLVGVEALAPRGERLHLPTVWGMLVGAVGIAFLVSPAISGFRSNPAVFGAFALLQFGCAGWAVGSIAQRKTTARAHPFISGAVQQLATGIVYAIPALIHPAPVHVTARGIGAVIYLMIFGSIIGYSAYVFAMDPAAGGDCVDLYVCESDGCGAAGMGGVSRAGGVA